MWEGGAGPGVRAACAHETLPRTTRQGSPHPARAAPPSLSAAIAARRPPRPQPPSPAVVAQIDSSVACLWFLTPFSAGTAAVAVLVAVTTNNWLHTEENMFGMLPNGTGPGLVAKLTVSGLWRLCHTEPGGTVFRCSDITYFPLEKYTPDPRDSATAIPYIVTSSAAPLLLAVLSHALGCVCCALGHCLKGQRICTFVAGVLFIITGLIMLTGIVMYISNFKGELGYKLRYYAYLDSPRMTYSYGYSFGLYMSGFLAVELAGTSAVFLFLQWYQQEWIIELTEQAKADCRAWDREYAFMDRDVSLAERRLMKRDTYPPTASGSATPSERRRFYNSDFTDVPHCSIHKNRKINLAASSLKDLSSSNLYGFPAAPRNTVIDTYFEDCKEPPHSANTLSGMRSASIFQSQASVASGRFLDQSFQERDEELVTFVGGRRIVDDGSVAGPSRLNRGVGTDTFRRTTPV